MRKKERAFYVSVKNLQQKKCNNHKLLKLASPKKYEMKDFKESDKERRKKCRKAHTLHYA